MIAFIRPLFYAGYEELFRKEGPFRPDDENNEYYYSTPTIARLHPDRADDFLIVCRLINCRNDPVTRKYWDYLPRDEESHLKSALALHRGIEDHRCTLITVLDEVFDKSPSFTMGPEDPKLLRVHRQEQRGDEEEFLVIFTSLEYPKVAGTGPRMAKGTLYLESGGTLKLNHAFPSPSNREWEKNWVAFQT